MALLVCNDTNLCGSCVIDIAFVHGAKPRVKPHERDPKTKFCPAPACSDTFASVDVSRLAGAQELRVGGRSALLGGVVSGSEG